MKIIATEEIPVADIDSGTNQVRTREVEEGLDDLAESIKTTMLIHPITVYKKDNGKYELIAGQRRFLAIKSKLKWNKIRATIIEKPNNELDAKLLSFIENQDRRKMANKDVANFCRKLKSEGKTMREIQKMLKIPYETVRSWVGIDGVPDEVRAAALDGKISAESAVRASAGYGWENPDMGATKAEQDESKELSKKILTMAQVMDTSAKTAEIKKEVVETIKVNPNEDPQRIIEISKDKSREAVNVKLYNKDQIRLGTYADTYTDGDKGKAAAKLILDGLDDAGV